MLENSSYRQIVQQQVVQELSYEESLLTRCPNILHKDGRIHHTDKDGKYLAVMVSPYHSQFHTQVESGVWEIINSLTNKGYLPVSSCQGHMNPWKEFYFTLAFNSEETAGEFIDQIKNVEYTKTTEFETLANVSQIGLKEYRSLEEHERNKRYEINDLNIMLFRNYSNYYFIRTSFDHSTFDLFFNPFNVFSAHWFHKKAINNFESWKKTLLHYIKNDLNEYLY